MKCTHFICASWIHSLCLQESGSIYLQFTCSTMLQLEVIFEVLEEYDWTSFSVVTTRHHGYEDFLAMVEGMTDGSFIGWERKSVVVLNVTDDPGGSRTKRLLKDNEAQVSDGKHKCHFWLRCKSGAKWFILAQINWTKWGSNNTCRLPEFA